MTSASSVLDFPTPIARLAIDTVLVLQPDVCVESLVLAKGMRASRLFMKAEMHHEAASA